MLLFLVSNRLWGSWVVFLFLLIVVAIVISSCTTTVAIDDLVSQTTTFFAFHVMKSLLGRAARDGLKSVAIL